MLRGRFPSPAFWSFPSSFLLSVRRVREAEAFLRSIRGGCRSPRPAVSIQTPTTADFSRTVSSVYRWVLNHDGVTLSAYGAIVKFNRGYCVFFWLGSS